VSKFSTRNPAHENALYERLRKDAEAEHISLGHRMAGRLNFPRRVSTAYYNAAVWRLYNTFADAVAQSVKEYGLQASVHVLKADGGTMPLSLSRERPVESILSGPAASVMGIMALSQPAEDCAILDIGGTTTDIAVFAEGSPVMERHGITLGSYPTLVRALKTVSIGIGGDSRVRIVDRRPVVGPDREGPPMAKGGSKPALMDAFNYLGVTSFGDRDASRTGIEKLAALWDMFPDKLARAAVDYAVRAVNDAVEDMVWDLNQRPVYTIHELLEGREVRPRRLYLMGGPAKAFQKELARVSDKDVTVPKNYGVANAIGAALTRTTMELELFADTEKRLLFIPNLGLEKQISARYSLEDAEKEARERLKERMRELGVYDPEAEAEITESESFNMVDLFGGGGRNIRVKCQVLPGIAR
jgi:N-methylhydantoinase A/oxoprolinase/acetone carboxylase beta subunit